MLNHKKWNENEYPGSGHHGSPCPPPPPEFRHGDPCAPAPHEGRPHPGDRGAHGAPHGHGSRGPRGKLTENPRYLEEDVNGKLLALIRVLGHTGHRMDGKGGQNRVLSILREEGEMTQRDLTEKLGVQPGSASEIIGKLEHAGYLLRTPSLTDRRTADVSLTEAGASRAAEAEAQRQERREKLFAALSEEEKQTLLPLLEKLSDAWEEIRKQP